MRRLVPASLLAATLLTIASSRHAAAVELPSVRGEPVLVDITNTSILNYRFNNRNDKPNDVSTKVDDHYGEWINRLNVQATWWRLRLGVRIDTALFAGSLARKEAKDVAAEELSPDASGHDRNDYANQILRELNSRFVNTYYPSKLSLGYTQPGVDVTLGDFYAQLGRGLVFSVRKLDELAVDTTVRGAKVAFDRELGPIHVGLTALAGQLNPLRLEETSGRRLQGDGSPLFFGFPQAQDLVTYEFNDVGGVIKNVAPARPNYLEDTVFAGRLSAGPSAALLAVNGSMLLRKSYEEELSQCVARGERDCASKYPVFEGTGNASRQHDTIRTFSGSVNVPSILGHGDLYVEVAGQQLRDGHLLGVDDLGQEKRAEDLSGYAVYVSATARGGPVAVSLEGKHYRRFFPLSANIDKDTRGFAAPEFDVVAYSQLPTVEPIYVQPIGAPNICVTGGRVRSDVRFTRQMSLYAWLGRYVSYSERLTDNVTCEELPELQTNTWDAAVGSELDFDKGSSHSRAWMGVRVTTLEVPTDGYISIPGSTNAFYQEGYIRYDIVKRVTGPFTLQAQGFHRHRFEPAFSGSAWTEGENYTALQWSPHISAILGYEYIARSGCAPGSEASVCHFVNGGLQWKSVSDDKVVQQIFNTVTLFVGQRRGALRCVSGVCRQFPPFEGAKLEVVSRF